MSLEILHREDLPLGGFAGLREHRLVMDPHAFGRHVNEGTWPGMGNFVYLADARFNPKGETGMHGHHEIDVISVMVEGRIAHKGSLEHGQGLKPFDVQVQRAGGEGFSHNEVNPDDEKNRMIQLWVLPETEGEPASYKLYHPEVGEVTRVYGGTNGQADTFSSKTVMDVAMLKPGQEVTRDGDFLAYLVRGKGTVNGTEIAEGDLIKGTDLKFKATDESQFILVHLAN